MNDYKSYLDVASIETDEPLDMSSLLGRDCLEYELEIGFGRGHFLLDRAIGNLESGIVGIETRRKWVSVVNERIDKRSLQNARVFHGDARAALSRFRKDAWLHRVFINFPDPWWKAKHEKRMVVTDVLVAELERLLVDGGQLFVQTDVDFRAEAYQSVLMKAKNLEPEGDNGVLKENPFSACSLREKKCNEVGLPVYRMLYSRKVRG